MSHYYLGLARYLAGQLSWHWENKKGIYDLMRRADGVEIRQGVTIINASRLETPGPLRIETGCMLHCGGNAWSNHEGYIRFGKGCWLAPNSIIWGGGGVEIGDCTGAGPAAMIFSSRDNYGMEHARKPHVVHHFSKVTVGSYVRIFSGVIVGPGVTIGDGAVIGANSVVLADVPPWSIAAGSPARVMGKRDRDERAEDAVRKANADGNGGPR